MGSSNIRERQRQRKQRRHYRAMLGEPDSVPPPRKVHALWRYQKHVCKLYQSLKSSIYVGQVLGCSHSVILDILHHNGVQPQEKSDRRLADNNQEAVDMANRNPRKARERRENRKRLRRLLGEPDSEMPQFARSPLWEHQGKIVKVYEAGYNMEQIAHYLGVKSELVRKILHSAGVKIRPAIGAYGFNIRKIREMRQGLPSIQSIIGLD